MIPKIIHYCWFGGNSLPPLAIKCLKSWRTNCPDYKIKRWNEENFNIASAPLYVRQAYNEKKWAFVSDYVRLYALVKYGGIYMDTDVEVIKSLDPFLRHKAFSGFEDSVNVPTGIMACEKGFPLFKEFLNYYRNANFYDKAGNISYTTNVTVITETCVQKGLKRNNQFQEIEGFALYPKSVFCPISYSTGKIKKTKDTVTIHWFAGSWQTKEQKYNHLKKMREYRIGYIYHIPKRLLRRLLGNALYESFKVKIKGNQK